MATGALDANGIWIYGEDDSEATFSALLNKLGDSTSDVVADIKQSGRVVQVLSAIKQTASSTTSTSMVDTGVTITITPRSATSKIMVFAEGVASNSVVSQACGINLVRNSTALHQGSGGTVGNESATVYPADLYQVGVFSLNFLDSPGTTSATTYKLQFKAQSSGTAYLGRRGQDSAFVMPTVITVMEVTA